LRGNVLRYVPSSTIRKFWIDNVTLRTELKEFGVDALLSLSDTSLPFPGVPHVLFVQQAYLAYPPSSWDFPLSLAFRAKMAIMAAYFRLGMPSIDRFVVQTQHMKRALCSRWGIAENMVEVIPTAVEIPAGITNALQQKPHSISVIGSAAPHKNLRILPKVMARLVRDVPDVTCSLTLTPKDVPHLYREVVQLGLTKDFEFLGKVSHEEALGLQASSSVSVIPSKLESFGLPYWEGLGVGAAMVVSDLVFGREICGDCALYAHPDDPADWAGKIGRLMVRRDEARELRKRARARFAEIAITPVEMARRFITVVEEVAR